MRRDVSRGRESLVTNKVYMGQQHASTTISEVKKYCQKKRLKNAHEKQQRGYKEWHNWALKLFTDSGPVLQKHPWKESI
jgi:hypothetical protein